MATLADLEVKTSELAGIVKSDSLEINTTLSLGNHFYRFDVAKGERYLVKNNSPSATLEIKISETGDESYAAQMTTCVTVPANKVAIFEAPMNALYMGFYNDANSVNVQISHTGHDEKVKNMSDIVLTDELHIEKTLSVGFHYYQIPIKQGEKYVIENNSLTTDLDIYTGPSDNPSQAERTPYGSLPHDSSMVIYAVVDADFFGFYNNANAVNIVIRHEGLNVLLPEMRELHQDMNAMLSTIDSFDNRISTSKAEAIAASKSYTDTQILSVSPTNILWSQLSSSLQDRIDGAGGTITNASDGEDLTVENSMLKFANKDATLMQYGGKSRVFLRKNIVNGKNVLCGCMISATNTIYILQYDYDLNNQPVTLGCGSTILFYGGSVKNGTLDYSHGTIIPMCDKIFGENLSVVTKEPVNIAWYGKKCGDSIDDIFDLLQGHTVIVPVGNYTCTKCGYTLAPNTMFIGEKVLNNDQTCCISFTPSNETQPFIIGVNNNCGFKNITLWLTSLTYPGDFLRVDSAFWNRSSISEEELVALKGQQYYIDNVYFYAGVGDRYGESATAFHVIVKDKDGDNVFPLYQQLLSYRQHFKNVEIKYFSVGICVEIKQIGNPPIENVNVWCNSLHFSDIDMWVRDNGFVLKTSGLTNSAQGRFIISNILLQPIGNHSEYDYPYAFYADGFGYDCMLDKINAWDHSKVAYVKRGSITLGQYVADDQNPLTVEATGVIKTLTWTEFSNNNQ